MTCPGERNLQIGLSYDFVSVEITSRHMCFTRHLGDPSLPSFAKSCVPCLQVMAESMLGPRLESETCHEICTGDAGTGVPRNKCLSNKVWMALPWLLRIVREWINK